jgi:16S rRNA (uracil1498-N3)-methyltransferase
MRLHRFYISPQTQLVHDLWLRNEQLLHQWNKVLRMAAGNELVLFNGIDHDRLYRIDILNQKEAHLLHVTDLHRNVPKYEVYLFWSLLKRDKNDWVLQKCTELGVSHFVPILAERCERIDLSQVRSERWHKIVIEAAEQCGRSDIPVLRQPMSVLAAIKGYHHEMTLCVADQLNEDNISVANITKTARGVFIGPEGGWSDSEKLLFEQSQLARLHLGSFTLRAETAAVTAASKLLS